MNKLLATLVAGTFAVVASSAFAQGTTPSTMEKAKEDVNKMQNTDKAKKFKADEKQLQDLSRNSPNPADQKMNVDKSKMDPKTKAKFDEKAAQELSRNSATNQADAKANVAASKASGPREKMPDIKKLSKEQRAELLRQLQMESKP
ncbi:MAG: hypothetical protein ABIR52_03900 [Casimicrobiaceae bacterium]